MLPHTLRIRSVAFAYLLTPPRNITREEASRVHAEVCEELGQDDFAFRYVPGDPKGPSRGATGFSLTVERTEGRGVVRVMLDGKDMASPIRLFLENVWPEEAVGLVAERFEMVHKAVCKALGETAQRVLAEVRIRAQCQARKGTGLDFIRENILKIPGPGMGEPLEQASVKFVIGSNPSEDPLSNPKRELLIEKLMEESDGIYLEFMAQWAAVPLKAEGGRLEFDLTNRRAIGEDPKAYIEHAFQLLKETVDSLSKG